MKALGMSPAIIGLSWKLGLWGLATWSVLRLHDAPIAQTHTICGPWGCGPTISALLAAHGFWLLVAIPGAFWVGMRLRSGRAVALGWVCLGLGGAGIVAVGLGGVMDRPKAASRLQARSFLTERVLFALATTVQVPLFPTAIAGLILLGAGRRRSRLRPSVGPGPDAEPEDNCGDGLCETTTPPDVVRKSGRIEVGYPLPGLTLLTRDGRALAVPGVANGRDSLLYFMRASGCSICRGHVRALAQIHEEYYLHGTDVFIVHPGGSKASKSLEDSLLTPFTIVSGREFRVYDAIGLSGRNFGLSRGSGTILIDRRGVIRHLRLASFPSGAFSRSELLDDYYRLKSEA